MQVITERLKMDLKFLESTITMDTNNIIINTSIQMKHQYLTMDKTKKALRPLLILLKLNKKT